MKTIRLLILGCFAVAVITVLVTTNGRAGRAPAGQKLEPGGMFIGVSLDQHQFTNPAVPVVAVRAVSGLTESEENKKQQYIMKEVILENRSPKDVSSVTLRWVIVPANSRTTSLARGEFKTHDLHSLRKTLRAGQRQTLKLFTHPRLFDLIRKIPNIEAMGNDFIFLVGVGEVLFEDGSSWKEALADASNKSVPHQLDKSALLL